MAQTRRMGKHKQKGGPTKSAEVFALPNYVLFLAELALPLFKLTRMGSRRMLIASASARFLRASFAVTMRVLGNRPRIAESYD
jgi:hypothetical protein